MAAMCHIKQEKRLQALQRAMQGALTQDVTPSCRAQAHQLQVAIFMLLHTSNKMKLLVHYDTKEQRPETRLQKMRE